VPVITITKEPILPDVVTGNDRGYFAVDKNHGGGVDYLVPWSKNLMRSLACYVENQDLTFSSAKMTDTLSYYIADNNGRDVGTFIDVNNDGSPDYCVPWNNCGYRNIATFLNNGDGFFTTNFCNTVTTEGFYSDNNGKDAGVFVCLTIAGLTDYSVIWNGSGKINLAVYTNKGNGYFATSCVNTPSSANFLVNTTNGREVGFYQNTSIQYEVNQNLSGNNGASFIVPTSWNGSNIWLEYRPKGNGLFYEYIGIPNPVGAGPSIQN
jgi:hypothetical protein